MSNLFISDQTQYEFFTTADGSPSICLSSDKYRPEAMHHREGALAESLFIYGEALNEALDLGCPPRVLSVGLGCGYNEMIATAHVINSRWSEEFYLESYEGDENLRNGFLQWLQSDSPRDPLSLTNLQTQIHHTFDQVLALVAAVFKMSPAFLKTQLLALKERRQLVIHDWLTSRTLFPKKFGMIFFDAFSSKSTPELWNEIFLIEFLHKAAAENCGLATYAATGTLNRALKKSGFTLRDQRGFSGKRESTRAFRLTNGVKDVL